jgi:DNA polymerase-3 subunit epsilon
VTPPAYAVVDVETSGLRPDRHRVLQVAVVHTDAAGAVTDEWVSLVRPPLGRFARLGPRRVHGLRGRVVARAPRPAPVGAELARRLEGRVVVAHNLAFDWPFLVRLLERAGVPVPAVDGLCTLELSRTLDAERRHSHRLAAVCERLGVDAGRPHDALEDARATAAVLPLLVAAQPEAPVPVPLGVRSYAR